MAKSSFMWFKHSVDQILDRERPGSSSIQFTIPREHILRIDGREVVNIAHNERVVFVEYANGEVARYDRAAELNYQLYSNSRVV